MKSTQTWLNEYQETHMNRVNQIIHKVCVPLILISITGLLSFIQIGPVNLAQMISVFALIFYARLGSRPFVLMGTVLVIVNWLVQDEIVRSLFTVHVWIFIFVAAWIGQFIGHKIEGKKPAFFQDLQFLLIGPLWVFKSILTNH